MALHDSLRYVVLVLLWSSVAKLPPPTLTQVLGSNSGLCTSGRHHCNPQTCLNRLTLCDVIPGETQTSIYFPQKGHQRLIKLRPPLKSNSYSDEFYRGFLIQSGVKGATYRNVSKTATLPRQKLTKAGNQMLTAQPTGSAIGGRVSVSFFSSDASFRQLCFSQSG